MLSGRCLGISTDPTWPPSVKSENMNDSVTEVIYFTGVIWGLTTLFSLAGSCLRYDLLPRDISRWLDRMALKGQWANTNQTCAYTYWVIYICTGSYVHTECWYITKTGFMLESLMLLCHITFSLWMGVLTVLPKSCCESEEQQPTIYRWEQVDFRGWGSTQFLHLQ